MDVAEIVWVREAGRNGLARDLRLRAAVTCDELAVPIGVDGSTVWRWETGARSPRGINAERYAAELRRLERLVVTSAARSTEVAA